jgi:hypothetical protein
MVVEYYKLSHLKMGFDFSKFVQANKEKLAMSIKEDNGSKE